MNQHLHIPILLDIIKNSIYIMKYRNLCDKIDIENGVKFRYYLPQGKYLKLNNQYPCSIFTNEIGKEIELLFEDTHNNDIIIKLSYTNNKYNYLRIKKEDLLTTKVTLVCVKYSETFGATWFVKKYTGNIYLE